MHSVGTASCTAIHNRSRSCCICEQELPNDHVIFIRSMERQHCVESQTTGLVSARESNSSWVGYGYEHRITVDWSAVVMGSTRPVLRMNSGGTFGARYTQMVLWERGSESRKMLFFGGFRLREPALEPQLPRGPSGSISWRK